MRYVPTVQQITANSRRILAGSTALVVLLSVVLSTVNSAAAYAHDEPVESAAILNETTEPEVPVVESAQTEELVTPVESTVVAPKSDEACPVDVTNVTVNGQDCNEDEEEVAPTLRELIDQTPQTSLLDATLDYIADNSSCQLISFLEQKIGEGTTVFAPSDAALSAIVRAPGTSTAELAELYANVDELCELISYHIHEGVIESADIPSSTTIDTLALDKSLAVKKTAGKVFVDQAQVTTADLLASNGVLHIVNDVLLPQEAGTINTIVTNSSSPALSGTINPAAYALESETLSYCVVVRIDGIAYEAEVNGTTWSIAKGIVSLDPLKNSTLFDVIVRTSGYDCSSQTSSVQAVAVNRLFGLTMQRDVVSYKATSPEEPKDEGEVLGETTDTPVITPAVTVTVAGSTCTKGDCVATGNEVDPSKKDTDGDGVVDSEDSEPNNPDVTGKEDSSSEEQANQDEQKPAAEDNSSEAFWWFIGGGGIAILWYLLWQRGGKENV